ncbi:MAG: cytochrome c, partial [Pseudomonadota bacterium]
MVRWFVALLATVAFSCAAGAQNLEVIEKRKAAFKDYLKYVKPGTGMVRGQAAFDLAQAKAVFTGISENSMRFDASLFPEDSKKSSCFSQITGSDSVLPPVFESSG